MFRGHFFSFGTYCEDFIALLCTLSLLQLIFASWNLISSLSITRSGMSTFFLYGQEPRVTKELYCITAPSMAIVIVFGSCMLLFSLALWVLHCFFNTSF